MATETISIKYKIPKLTFSTPATFNQVFTLDLKLKGSPDSSYDLLTTNYQTDVNGNNINNYIISSLVLLANTEYTIRFTNNEDTTKKFSIDFKTGINMSIGDSPYLNKVYYKGQTVDWYYAGLLSQTLPSLNGGFFFTWDGNYREIEQNVGNMVPSEGTAFKTITDVNITTRKLQGLYFNGTNYVKFNDVNVNRAGQVRANDIFGDNSDKEYSINLFLTVENLTNKTIIHTVNDANNEFHIYLSSNKLVVSVKKDGAVKTATSQYDLTVGRLYLLDLRIHPGNASANTGILYNPSQNINLTGITDINHSMVTTEEPEIYLGRNLTTSINATGLMLSRFYFCPTITIPNGDSYKLQDPWGYVPSIRFKSTAGGADIVIPDIWKNVLSDEKITFVIPPEVDFLPAGTYDCWIQNYQGQQLNKKLNVNVRAFTKDTVGFDIDFSTGVYADKIAAFKNTFYAFHGQWGGANGGVNANLIYFKPETKAVVFEAHGDNYVGEVQGVGKPAKDSSYSGYGVPKIHDIPADPKYLQQWKTRVGSVAVTKKYCGYGEWSTWLKVPTGSYGYSPALWFFHYQELYPTDPRWQFWIDKGAKPYGGADPYMVINNEIDMELPSHITQGSFADWAELALAYFDPLALDTQYRVGIETGSTSADVGLFRLTNTSAPNLKSSWVKESDTWAPVNQPSMSNCKFNNWVGERSSGNGWAYDEESYEGEEYLALLTKLEQNYADSQFHKWTIKWYKDRTELWIDDVKIRTNRAFVPYIPGRLTFGAWFPSGVSQSSENYWEYTPARAWAGYPANFSTLNLEIQRISFTPYDVSTAGGDNEYFSESFPDANLREFI